MPQIYNGGYSAGGGTIVLLELRSKPKLLGVGSESSSKVSDSGWRE